MTASQPPKPSSDLPSSKNRSEWSLTKEALDKLFAAFSQDIDDAAKQYEALRLRLIRYFEWRSISLPEDRADETLNRVARRIDEGQQVSNVVAYAWRVAYLVFLEVIKEPQPINIDDEKIHPPVVEPQFDKDPEQDQRQLCFDDCLAALPMDQRKLILLFHQEERRAKIELRKSLAEQHKMSLNALRIRAHRIRKGLEECIADCLQQPAMMRNVTR